MSCDSGSFDDVVYANLIGGVTVTGYLSGTLGVCSAISMTHYSYCIKGCHVSRITRTGAG